MTELKELDSFLGIMLSRKQDAEIRDVKDKYRREQLFLREVAPSMKEYIVLEEAYNNFMRCVSEICKEAT